MSKSPSRIRIPFDRELPHGWAWVTITDLIPSKGVFSDGDWIESKDQDPRGDVRLIQLADIGEGTYRNRSSRFLTLAKADELNCTYLKPGDMLIARMPDPLGRSCIFPGDSKRSVTAVDVCIVRSGENTFDHRWLMHWINSPAFRQQVAKLQSGTTRKRISRKNLARIEFPVPPSKEQIRIVEKVDELVTQLDAGVGSLFKAKALLKRYRQSVLKAAMAGKLTSEWREKNKGKLEPASELLKRVLAERRKKWEANELAKMKANGKEPKNNNWKKKYKEPETPDASDLPELPASWTWSSIEQLSCLVTKGSSPRWQGFPYVDSGVPFVRSQNVRWGYLDVSNLVYVPYEFNEKEPRSILQTGDVLLNIVGASIGRAAVALSHIDGGNTNQAVSIIRILEGGILPELLVNFLVSSQSQARMHAQKVEVARPNLSLRDVSNIAVPLMPQQEQTAILQVLQAYEAVIDHIVEQLKTEESRCRQLSMAILRDAFQGKLIDQDPSDEPASAMLKRIKVNRPANDSGRTRKKRVKQERLT